jgi:geranylgeranyl pyrophosphate synthase
MATDLNAFLGAARERVDAALDEFLPNEFRIDRAVRYCVFNGGKRVRPCLVYATADALGIARNEVDAIAVAIELIHAYSLVHDDLPAMDDDDLRRGQPTCHIEFDEATAILAGDALQSLAFEALITLSKANQRSTWVGQLARAAGSRGMILGQALDIDAEGKPLTEEALESMHRLKTGELIDACIEMPKALIDLDSQHDDALSSYGRALGLAFQVQDDILDVVADTSTLGKPSGSDQYKHKPTYTSILGLEGARTKLSDLHQQATSALQETPFDTTILQELANYIVERTH